MDYYLNYEQKDDLTNYFEFLKELNNNIIHLINKDAPFIGGDFEKDYNSKLDSKQLNDNGLNSSDLAKEMSSYFSGLIRWHNPYSFYNVKSPVNIYGAAVSALSALYDSNLANVKICGNMASAELEVIKYLAEVSGYDKNNAGGYFTFGGTSTLLNAIKVGLNRAIPFLSNNGLRENVFIVCSEQEHHSIVKCCNWLGVGKDNCVMIPTDGNYQFDIDKAESVIRERIRCNQKLVTIIACGGTTTQNIVDPIHSIFKMRERLVKEFRLPYSPNLHVDAVVGWPILFFQDYSFEENPLDIRQETLDVIYSLYQSLKDIHYADSFGVDFHKTGFCPFLSSVFITKHRNEFTKINGKIDVDFNSLQYGDYNPCDYVLETSRPLSGAISALTVLKSLGKNGMRSEIAKITNANLYIRSLMYQLDDFEIINGETFGINIMFIVKPVGYCCYYRDIPEMGITKAYRLAKYNYDFYLFCLKKIDRSNLFFNYSSGLDKGRNRIFFGVLQLQSFSPLFSESRAKQLIKTLQSLKKEFDLRKEPISVDELPFKPHEFKYHPDLRIAMDATFDR